VIEKRTYNEARAGYDVEGPCWNCGSPIRYFVDEDGTPRDIRRITDASDAAATQPVDPQASVASDAEA